MRVLLVQSNAAEASRNLATLECARFVVDHAQDSTAGFEFAHVYNHDIVVLDCSLSDMDGCQFLRRMRAQNIVTPVLLLKNPGAADLTVSALRHGADDVLTKPFRSDEFVARIETIVRRSHGHGQAVLQIGRMLIDMTAHEVFVDGKRLNLSRKEYEILQLLGLRRGRLVTSEFILEHLYGGDDIPDISIIRVFVCYLRRKLAAANADDLIETVRGYGYVIRGDGRTALSRYRGMPGPATAQLPSAA